MHAKINLGGLFYIKYMLKSIGALVLVRSREVVRFSEGPLREVHCTYIHTYSTLQRKTI